jgi:hypothetical protein
MPYRLRKAPKRDLYWVVGEDGTKHSKEPIPKERAESQRKALYIAMREKRGGAELHGDGELHGGAKNFRNFVKAVSELRDELGEVWYNLMDTPSGTPTFVIIDKIMAKAEEKMKEYRTKSRGLFGRKTEIYDKIQEDKDIYLKAKLTRIRNILNEAEPAEEFYDRMKQGQYTRDYNRYEAPPPEEPYQEPYPPAYEPEARTSAEPQQTRRSSSRKSPPVRPLPTDKPSRKIPKTPEQVLQEYGIKVPMESGNPTDSEMKEAKKLYHRLSIKLHPDKGGDATKYAELNAAYQTLYQGKGKFIQRKVRK